MKLRTQRVHHMGGSNRDLNPLPFTSHDVFEKSYVKSHSSFYKTNVDQTSASPARPDPLQGSHAQQQTLRWDPKSKKQGREAQWRLGKGLDPLDRSGELNADAKGLVKQFSGKEVNMFKLGELKRTFVKNNRKRRNLNAYFNNFATEGRLSLQALQRIVGEYGYDISAEEARLVARLSGSQDDFLTQEQFVELMTKDNVLFGTLKLDGAFGKPKVHFQERIHLVFRNKADQLRQAFRIYRMRGQPVDRQKFDYVMRKLDINDLVVSADQRSDLFNKFTDQTGYFNAERLFCAISEQQQAKSPTFPPRLSNFDDNLKANQERQAKLGKKWIDFDFKRVSNLQYQIQLIKAREVHKQLTQLPDCHTLIFTQGNILSKEAVRERVEAVLQRKGINCSKEEYDCFVSSLDYNTQQHISSQQFKSFLNQTPKQAQERHQRRLRALPPRLAPPQIADFDSSAAIESLKKVKDKGLGTEMRTIFKQFDKDKDGFVSKQQLKEQLGSMAVLEKWEIDNLSNYFQEGKGYVDFSTFANKFALGDLEPENPTESVLKARSQSDWASTKRTTIRNNNNYTCNVPSKYSAWPQRLKRTDFSLVQPPSKAGQFLGQEGRFQVEEKHWIGQQAKQERHRIYENKLRKLAAWNELAQERAAQSERKTQLRSQANDYLLRLTKQTYEQHCHQYAQF